MRCREQFLFIVFLFCQFITAASSESANSIKSLYEKGFYDKAFVEASGSSEYFSGEQYWLLAEMYYLGRGVGINDKFAKEYILKASQYPLVEKKRRSFIITNKINYSTPLRTVLPLNYLKSETIDSNCYGRSRQLLERCRCDQIEPQPIELFFYLSNFLRQ